MQGLESGQRPRNSAFRSARIWRRMALFRVTLPRTSLDQSTRARLKEHRLINAPSKLARFPFHMEVDDRRTRLAMDA